MGSCEKADGAPENAEERRLLKTYSEKPGGGYLFDFNGCLENAKKENIDKMFEMLELYGKY